MRRYRYWYQSVSGKQEKYDPIQKRYKPLLPWSSQDLHILQEWLNQISPTLSFVARFLQEFHPFLQQFLHLGLIRLLQTDESYLLTGLKFPDHESCPNSIFRDQLPFTSWTV